MINTVVVVLRPVADRFFSDTEVVVDVVRGDFNRAVRDAIRRVSKSYPKNVVHRFDVLSIEVI